MTARRLGPAAIAVVTALAIAACATAPTPSPLPTAVTAPNAPSLTLPPGGATAGPSESVKPAPTVAAPVLDEAVLTCGTLGLVFPAAALDRPAGQERGSAPEQAALRVYLESPEVFQTGWPTTGWWAVDGTPDRVTYLAPGKDEWWVATFERHGDVWEFSEGGQCPLAVALPSGVGFASWRLDPAAPPTPDATTIRVLGTEAACANGKAPVGRILAPVLLERNDAVTIVLLVRTIPGGADCPGNPEFPQSVELTAPLGDRPLFDGSTVPPAART
jgi:hypothetical protein